MSQSRGCAIAVSLTLLIGNNIRFARLLNLYSQLLADLGAAGGFSSSQRLLPSSVWDLDAAGRFSFSLPVLPTSVWHLGAAGGFFSSQPVLPSFV